MFVCMCTSYLACIRPWKEDKKGGRQGGPPAAALSRSENFYKQVFEGGAIIAATLIPHMHSQLAHALQKQPLDMISSQNPPGSTVMYFQNSLLNLLLIPQQRLAHGPVLFLGAF